MINAGMAKLAVEAVHNWTDDPHLTEKAAIAARLLDLPLAVSLEEKSSRNDYGSPYLIYLRHSVEADKYAQTVADEAKNAQMLWAGIGDLFPSRANSKQIPLDFSDQLSATDVAVPLLGLCERSCPDGVSPCYRLAHGLVGGGGGLYSLRSPVQSIISNDQYRGSERAVKDALALLTAKFRYRSNWKKLPFFTERTTETCLIGLIAETLE